MPACLSSPAPASTPLDGVARLPDLGVIRARGADAASFLQAQLTQDMEQIHLGRGRLAALCNARGRMLASFIVCRSGPEEFLLACAADLLAPTLARLSRFVLRSRVQLTEASADVMLRGLLGASAAQWISTAAQPGRAADTPCVATLPAAEGEARALWLATAGSPEPEGPVLAAADWELAAVRSGAAMVSAAVSEAFLPQMLNYESLDGVSFRKGCYPGQEVVARSQFRGAVKRRAWVGHVAGEALAGDEVLLVEAPGQPCGQVAQAAAAPGGGTAVIAVLQDAAVERSSALVVGAASGPALTGLHRPYALLEI